VILDGGAQRIIGEILKSAQNRMVDATTETRDPLIAHAGALSMASANRGSTSGGLDQTAFAWA
jgi:hypothetical protein